ncbi:hypothetical protein [Methylobacterium oryzisoli]|uniref:hypothetical protein n=1 Tax=Methylobacterium oryzisoli TaxID=3385502 RepID=UPI0038911E44
MAIYHLRAARPYPGGVGFALLYDIRIDAATSTAAIDEALTLPSALIANPDYAVWLADSEGRVIWSAQGGEQAAAHLAPGGPVCVLPDT